MNATRTPMALFVVQCLGFLLFVGYSMPLLPERMASHFNAGGQPDGWMTREAYRLVVGAMGLGLPLFIIGLVYATRFFPDWTINLPHKEYWLSPEQRSATNAWILRHAFWLACLVLCLVGSAHYLTIQANRSVPVKLPAAAFTAVMAGFLVGVAIWVVAMVRHFRRPS